MNYRYRGILFDLDGTLINSIEDISDALNAALKSEGILPLSLEETEQVVGNGLKNSVSGALKMRKVQADPVYVDLLFSRLMEYYRLNPARRATVYPGVRELLSSLTIPFGVISNKDQSLVPRIMETVFPEIQFSFISGRVESLPVKPDPYHFNRFLDEQHLAPQEVLYVGDSEVDARFADNAHSALALVSWGFRRKAVLEKIAKERVCDNIEELKELIYV